MSALIRRLASWGVSPLFAFAFVVGVLIVAAVVVPRRAPGAHHSAASQASL